MEKRTEGKIRNWLKKLQIKGFMAGVLVTVILSGTMLVSANTGGAIREVFYGVNVTVNGNRWNPSAGMEPFVSGGVTFLPVRGISEALDIPVEWHGSTRTVYIGSIPHGTPFSNITPFENQNILNNANATMLGITYSNVIVSTSQRFLPGVARYALNGNYTTFSGNVGRADNQQGSQTISFIGDGRELLTVTVDENTTQFIPISVDLSGILILEIRMTVGVHRTFDVSFSRPLFVANAMIQ